MRYGFVSRLIMASAFSVISAYGFYAVAQRPATQDDRAEDSRDKASLWMRHKLSASQKILEGMTRGDYELIQKNAKDMHVLGYLEGAIRSGVPEYKTQLRAFDHALVAIVRNADEKNLDGVTIAYTQMTISCVQCHKVIRDNVTQ